MRRSAAPSIKSNGPRNLNAIPTSAINVSKRKLETKRTHDNNIEHGAATREDNQIFNVVWSKRTTKKHKTWEGDGFLIVRPKFIVLKDQNHQVLGTSSTFKLEEIVEGNQISVGSKEVEIIEKLNIKYLQKLKPTENKIENEENISNIDEPKEKKKKSCHSFVPNLQLSSTPNMRNKFPLMNLNKTKTNNPIEDNTVVSIDTLTLPTPSYACQWEYNKNKLPLVEVTVNPEIVKHLRPHQIEGIKFLYDCLLGFKNKDYFGAILADEMGLGKTLQCLAICHTLLKQGPFGGNRCLQRVLIVTPSSLADNWNREIAKWLGFDRMYAYTVDIKHKIKNYLKQNHIPFVITSYETLVANYNDFESIQFDLLVCDEGHRLKNNQIKASICLQQLNIARKIILTGTPIQNDLQEFFYLIDFVNSGILGSYQEYKSIYENPICKSQEPDATEDCKAIGLIQAEILNDITSKFIIRRTQTLNQKYLPKKREYIVFVSPSELQILLIKKCLEWYENNKSTEDSKYCNPLQIINILQKICNHPSLLNCTASDNPLVTNLIKILPNWKNLGIFDSSKMKILKKLIEETLEKNERIVIVSNSTKTMDMIKIFLEHAEYKFLRLDGTTPVTKRQSLVEEFNKKNSQYSIFLLSAKAGGMGLNLCGASRLILYDNDWNPSVDLQAMSRIWRDGQEKDVKIYRLITLATIEEKILQRQISKTNLSGCLMGGNSKDGLKFNKEDLKDLFSFKNDFDICSIHESLQCNCKGVGEILENSAYITTNENNENDDPYRISLTFTEDNEINNSVSVQINELMKWEHYKPPFNSDFLKESSLDISNDQIKFVFSKIT